MKQPITLREIVLFGAFLIVSYFAFVKKWDSNAVKEDKIRAEERVIALEANAKIWSHLSDSLKSNVASLEAVVKYQKENPKLIIEKYDKIRDNINVLNADASVRLLSARLSKEGSNR